MDASKATLPLFKKTDHNMEEAIPKTAEVILRAGLSIPIASLPSFLINELKRIASFHNPEFYKAQKMRFSTWDKPRIISCAELEEGVMTLPRGCIDAALDVFARAGINAILDDQRSEGESIDLSFNGVLRDEQQEVIDEMSRHSNGVLSAPTGFGKTVIAAALISRFKCSALVIVHTRPLLLQWKERIYEFLGIAPGLLGGGKNSLTGQIDIAVINSLTQEQYHTTLERYGLVIVDECHHVAAISYEQVLKRVRAKNVYGLTATPMRSDGHHDIIFMQCGPIVKRIDQKIWRQQGAFDGKAVTRFTSFRCDYQRLSIQEVYEKLSQDDERNLLLASDIVAHAEENRSILILSNRLKHLDRLQELLAKRGLETLLMNGSQSVKEKRRVQEYLDELKAQGRPALILSTGKYIGEGFDFPTLDTLILASPIAWRGSITQYVGRVSRIHEGKSDILVLDYVDFKIPVLNRMFAKRVRAFKKEGFAITQFGQQPDDDLLYTDQTYWAPLLRDLKNARGPIMFSAPYVSISKIQQLLPFLRELSESKKVVMRLPTKSNISLLATSGIAIQQTSKETVNCILIDERILWYGSINIFGAANEDDTLLRIEDPTYAAEVIRWVENEQIDAQRENLL